MPAIVEREPCYIYHIREYQEHSLILEAISLNYGAIAILARGAKRPDSPLQGLIQPFAPLSLSLQLGQKGDLYYLRDFEYCPGGYKFKMPEFFCAFYLNELLHHLYHGKESDRLLFGTYIATLEAIAHNDHIEHNLRNFELSLLKSIGYELSPIDEHGEPVAPDKNYRFCFGQGFIEVDPDFMTQVMTSQRSSATTQAQIAASAPSSDATNTEPEGASAESAMLFAKSKIRGPKLEDTRARLSPGQDAWMRRAMSQGVSSSQIQRYYEYGADLLGPILTGAQIHDIVTLACKLPQSAHNAKLLTASIINRLLGGKELQSRKLYREYLTMLKQKAPNAAPTAASAPEPAAPNAAPAVALATEPAAPNTDAVAPSAEQPQAEDHVKSDDEAVADNLSVATTEAPTQEVTELAPEAKSTQEDAEPVAEVAPLSESVAAEPASNTEASQDAAETPAEAPPPSENVAADPAKPVAKTKRRAKSVKSSDGIEARAESTVSEPQAEDQVKSEDEAVAGNTSVAAPEVSTQEVTEPEPEAKSSQDDAEPVAEIAPSQDVAEPQAANVEAEPASQAEASQVDATPVAEASQAASGGTDPVAEAPQAESAEAEPVVEVPQAEIAEAEPVVEASQVESAESQPEVEAKPTKSTSKTKRRTKTAKSTEPQGESVETEHTKPAAKTKRRTKAAKSHEVSEDSAKGAAAKPDAKPKRTKGSAAKSSQAKASSKARKGAGAARKGRSSTAEVAPDEEPEAATPNIVAQAQAALAEAEELLILAPEILPEPEAPAKPQRGKQDKQVKKAKKLTRAQFKAQQKAEAEAQARAEQERMAASPYDESMLMMLDASLTKRPRRKKTVAH